MHFSVFRSSLERHWNGFDATIYDTTPGIDETLFSDHCVSMHLGPPVVSALHCDGARVHRVQRAGDLKIIPAGFSRLWEAQDRTRKVSIKLGRVFLQAVADSMHLPERHATIEPRLELRDPRIEHVAWALTTELEADVPAGSLYADSLGLALAAHVLGHYASEPPPRISRGLSERRLRRVLEYIGEYATRDLALAELAGVAGVSPSHFNLLFKRSTGVSVHRYVVRVRVERALRLLAEGELPVSAVALEAGFANQSHLATWMRRIVGTTPLVFRRSAESSFDRVPNRANLSDGATPNLIRLPALQEATYEEEERSLRR
jgi:AraC family transcriptional regulator